MSEQFELVEEVPRADEAEFPVAIHSPLEALFGSYAAAKQSIVDMAAYLGDRTDGALKYFFSAAAVHDRWAATIQLDRLFRLDHAVAALDADYWQRAIQLTDVLDVMPAEKRNQWSEAIRKHATPAFDRDAVMETLRDLLLQRERFFCERIDGLFRRLSGNHVTNAPEGFGRRMILDYFISSYGSLNWDRIEYVHDLRFVIASFLGRDKPSPRVTTDMVTYIFRTEKFGQWHDFDGGAFRFKLYKKGTVHLEVHPDMAWRLNAMLAKLYPLAIPARFRQRSAKAKEFNLTATHLDEDTIVALNAMTSREGGFVQAFPYRTRGEHLLDGVPQAEAVLANLGGVKLSSGDWQFDYSATDAINEVIRLGRIPDESYQFHPTPTELASEVLRLAEIEDAHTVLEPEAGQGAIAQLVPNPERMTCVEISPLYCTVLRSKGLRVIEGDFLSLAPRRFDRIVMNPPFSMNRAAIHVKHAAEHWLKPRGRLVAVLPASLKDKVMVPGAVHQYSGPYRDCFAGTSVSVVVLSLSVQREG